MLLRFRGRNPNAKGCPESTPMRGLLEAGFLHQEAGEEFLMQPVIPAQAPMQSQDHSGE